MLKSNPAIKKTNFIQLKHSKTPIPKNNRSIYFALFSNPAINSSELIMDSQLVNKFDLTLQKNNIVLFGNAKSQSSQFEEIHILYPLASRKQHHIIQLVVDVKPLIAPKSSLSTEALLSVQLTDNTTTNQSQVFFNKNSKITSTKDPINSYYKHLTSFTINHNPWLISCFPTNKFLLEHQPVDKLVILFIGFVTTILWVMYLLKTFLAFNSHTILADRLKKRSVELEESQELYRQIAQNFSKGTINVLDLQFNYIFAMGKEFNNLYTNPF